MVEVHSSKETGQAGSNPFIGLLSRAKTEGMKWSGRPEIQPSWRT